MQGFNGPFRVRAGGPLRLAFSQVSCRRIWDIQSPYQGGLEVKQAWTCHTPLSLKVPNVTSVKDSFPDHMSHPMGDNCRELAHNVYLGMEQRLDHGNQDF